MYFSITVRNEYQRLEAEIERLELEIAKFPAGELRAYKSGKRTKFYCRTEEGDYLYIKRADKDRLLKLARKGLYLAEKKDLLEQREYLRGLLDAPSGIAVKKKYLAHPGIKELLGAAKASFSEWEEAPYERSSEYPERLVVPTKKGDMVRSKSEGMIADALFQAQIPYRYEAITPQLKGVGIPDFIVLSPYSRHEIVWEHFGMMDRPDYCRRASGKLKDYFDLGLIPDQNLICTYESKEHPLNLQSVEEQIKKILTM